MRCLKFAHSWLYILGSRPSVRKQNIKLSAKCRITPSAQVKSSTASRGLCLEYPQCYCRFTCSLSSLVVSFGFIIDRGPWLLTIGIENRSADASCRHFFGARNIWSEYPTSSGPRYRIWCTVVRPSKAISSMTCNLSNWVCSKNKGTLFTMSSQWVFFSTD